MVRNEPEHWIAGTDDSPPAAGLRSAVSCILHCVCWLPQDTAAAELSTLLNVSCVTVAKLNVRSWVSCSASLYTAARAARLTELSQNMLQTHYKAN